MNAVQVKDNRFANIDIQNRDVSPLLSREEGEKKRKKMLKILN